MKKKIKCLDKGFVKLIDTMGDDSSIVQAARVSYGKGTKSVNEDKGLINYLMRHYHTSPIEMVEFKFHIKCPIFVMRQLIRHRTASVNEVSARYSVVADEFYVPEKSRVKAQSRDNKQGSGGELDSDTQTAFMTHTRLCSKTSYENYLAAVNEGIARELARINLPLTAYTEFYWKIDLLNLLKFIRLRSDSHAQYEIRVFSDALAKFVKHNNPLTYAAFKNYWQESISLSKLEQEVILKTNIPKGLTLSYESKGELFEKIADEILSKGEKVELRNKLNILGVL